MIFRSQRLIARAFEDSDLEVFVAMRADPEVARYQNWENYIEKDGRARIEELKTQKPGEVGWFQFAVVGADNGDFIGDCGLKITELDTRLAELGYTIARQHWNKGYAGELIRALTDYAFRSFPLHRIFASVDPRNLGSCRVLEKTGFTKEAHLRQSVWLKGEWTDDAIYGLLRNEWEAGEFTPHPRT